MEAAETRASVQRKKGRVRERAEAKGGRDAPVGRKRGTGGERTSTEPASSYRGKALCRFWGPRNQRTLDPHVGGGGGTRLPSFSPFKMARKDLNLGSFMSVEK